MADIHDDLNFGITINSDQQQQARKNQGGPTSKATQGMAKNTGEGMAPQNEQSLQIGKNDYDLSAAAHPVACIFTFAFKLAAFLMQVDDKVRYFFGGLFFSSIIIFIVVVLLSALDFWTVKNVTGRLLVGLRWWSDYDKEGKQIWKFESYDREFASNPVDKTFFWTSQLVFTLLWVVFLVIKILGLSFYWALLVFINLSLCATNLYGYYKCRGGNPFFKLEYSKKLNDLKSEYGKKGLMQLAGKFI